MKIQFYLNEILTDTLKSKAVGEESLHLTAKRLMEDLLKGEVVPSAIAASPDALAEIRDRLLALERIAPIAPDNLAELSDRLSDLENRWDINTGERLAKLEDKLSVVTKAVTALEKCREADLLGQMASLEKTILGPTLPKKEIPQGLTHKELAAAIGSSERTMQRVAKEKERWPDGYHWSEESKKWFSMEG